MNTSKNTSGGTMTKVTFGILAVAMLMLASARQAQAQLPTPPPVTLDYSFDLPVVKAIPNPCTTGGFALLTGNLKVKVTSTDSGSNGYILGFSIDSIGKGEDALPSGSLILDGTQKSKYVYSSLTNGDASFRRKPAYYSIKMSVNDIMFREYGDGSDSVVLESTVTVIFTNGVPGVPVIDNLNVRCGEEEVLP